MYCVLLGPVLSLPLSLGDLHEKHPFCKLKEPNKKREELSLEE